MSEIEGHNYVHVLIESLREEIQFLRSQNKDLTERIMAFSGHAHQAFLSRDIMKLEVPAPHYLDEVTGQIVNMEAVTKEEKEQQEQALKQVSQLLGA